MTYKMVILNEELRFIQNRIHKIENQMKNRNYKNEIDEYKYLMGTKKDEYIRIKNIINLQIMLEREEEK